MMENLTLPEGWRGQTLALVLTAVAVMAIWLAAVAPLLGWYQARGDQLAAQQQLVLRMTAAGREIPALREAVRQAGLASAGNAVLLAGGSDAVAGANLQSALQGLAAQAGTSLDSAALLQGEPAGSLRRLGLQVSVTATWPVLIALLTAIDTAHPRMIIDGLSVTNDAAASASQEPAMQASFSVAAFRAGTAP